MITQLILDQKYARAGTPVHFVDWELGHKRPGFNQEAVRVELPDGREVIVDAAAVSSGVHSPEETLSALSRMSGVREDTLLKAAQSGRLMARKSGTTWLSTLAAVEWAVAEGRIRKFAGEKID